MSFRKEYKFRVTVFDSVLLRSELLEKGMSTLYPRRRINSLYFDTVDLKIYSDSEEGLLPRSKHRIRWYDDGDIYNQENKVSSLEGRYKTSNILTKKDYFQKKSSGFFTKDYGFLIASMEVSYQREYFYYQGVRVTFDTQISYSPKRLAKGLSLKDSECVVEVKTPNIDSDDFIFNLFPYPISRFSKYSRGFRILEKSI